MTPKIYIQTEEGGALVAYVPESGALVLAAASSVAGGASASGHFDGPGQPIDLLAAQVQPYTTVGASSGPCKAIIRVVPGVPKIVTATFGPADGVNFATLHASIAGVPLPERGNGTSGGMVALGLNGAPGADINLTTGDHELIIQNAAAGDLDEKKVVFVIQP